MVCAFSTLAVGEGPTVGGRRAERALAAGRRKQFLDEQTVHLAVAAPVITCEKQGHI
jgi:hypothetical protein